MLSPYNACSALSGMGNLGVRRKKPRVGVRRVRGGNQRRLWYKKKPAEASFVGTIY